MPLIRHRGSGNHDISVSEVPVSTRTGTVIQKSESEGKQGSNCITPRLGKHSRPFSWQRHRCKKQKQLTFEENGLNILPTNTDCLRASFQCDNANLSYLEKVISSIYEIL